MALRSLSLREFDKFNSARATVARHTDKAVEWFTDDTGAVLGAIAYHHVNLEWSLVVLTRDRGGEFSVSDRDAGLRVLDDARRILEEKMVMALAAGDKGMTPRAAA